jgi:hypothetical protein
VKRIKAKEKAGLIAKWVKGAVRNSMIDIDYPYSILK